MDLSNEGSPIDVSPLRQEASQTCYYISHRLKVQFQLTKHAKKGINPRFPSGKKVDDVIVEVIVDESQPDRKVQISATLSGELKEVLVALLRKRQSFFRLVYRRHAWYMSKCHLPRAKRRSKFKLVKQKRRKLGTKRAKAVNDKVDKLLKIGSIREV